MCVCSYMSISVRTRLRFGQRFKKYFEGLLTVLGLKFIVAAEAFLMLGTLERGTFFNELDAISCILVYFF